MKRSQINKCIHEALQVMKKHNFYLPDWATYTPEKWNEMKKDCQEIKENGLGWDLTDFGSGDFYNTGLTLITLRNGNLKKMDKPYCEKIMFVRKNQVTPTHFHWNKTEDIINRGGGVLCMKLWKANKKEEPTQDPIELKVDGISRTIQPGEVLKLKPGQSVCYTPYLYHTFWAEEDDCIVGEVSAVNDDVHDNRFLKASGRFPAIEEDEKAEYLLCNEYPF